MGNDAKPDPLAQIETSSGASCDPSSQIDGEGFLLRVILKRMRIAIGMSQRELAKRSGIRQPHICAIEAGKDALLSTYERMAKALGVNLVYETTPARPRADIVAELVAERLAGEARARERRWERRVRRRSR